MASSEIGDEVPVTDESVPPEVPVADVDPLVTASALDTSTSSAALGALGLGVTPQTPPPSPTYVDPSGTDPTKNDEVPSSRDGKTPEEVTYSDGVCPLLGEGSGVKKTAEVGGYAVTTHQPYRVLTDPVECPTCKKLVESPQLTWDMSAGGGTRDCATAINLRAHPVSKEVQAALDDGAYGKAERIVDRHPMREKFLRLLGFRR